MKPARFTAAIVAAMTMIAPFSLSKPVLAVPEIVFAEGKGAVSKLPDWIPSDFDSALEFHNTYGAVHIDNGLICLVLKQYDSNIENDDSLSYKVVTTENVMDTLNDSVYTSDKTDTKFEVFVYQPTMPGDIEVAVCDTRLREASLDLENIHALVTYTFNVDKSMNVTETDIYSWLPDSAEEYREYSLSHFRVSVKDNYVVFCLSHNAGTAYNWIVNDSGRDCFKLAASSDCTKVSSISLDGGEIQTIYAYKAVADGYAKISYDFGAFYGSGKVEETETADCVVLDDAQSVLLSGDMRVTLVDSDTDEPIIFSNDENIMIWTNVSYETPEGTMSTGPILEMTSNHSVVDHNIARFFDADSFSFGLMNAPAGYSLPSESTYSSGYFNDKIIPDDYMTVEKFDNNAAEVVFRLKFTPTGDLNGDGEFNVTDAVLLQKWLLGGNDTKLTGWKNADLNNDNVLDMFDFCLIKQKLLQKNYVEPDERFEYGMMFRVMEDGLKLYLGPDESYEAVASIPADIRLIELGTKKGNDTWLFTEYDGQYGWINSVKDDNTTSTIVFEAAAKKPVIYLYPEQETDVHVELELTEADLNTTYPKYNNGWDVVAYPDGTLLNKADGSHHKYLFWDAVNCRTKFDFSTGFCIAGSDTESFLKEKLTSMGLTEEEMNDFIVYWLPLMEHNAYNLISFQGDAYTNSAKLNITPSPDSECRIFMAYVPLDDAVDIEPQQLETFERKGFSVVEWGGAEINSKK